ncbi:hypothetical protein Tco_0349042 [Tanacetum coccineum]
MLSENALVNALGYHDNTVNYFEDIDYFKDFENEFPAIVYKDALTPEPKVSSEPTVRHPELKRRNLKNTILTSYTPYPSRKIWRICVCPSQETTKTYTPYPGDLIRRFDRDRRILEVIAELPSHNFVKDLPGKGVGLRVADSYTCNHRKDDFTPLATFQRYPTSVRVFCDPILFLAGLQALWEHGQQRPAIIKWLSGTSFMLRMRNIYLFLPKEPSPGLGTGSPSMSVNMEPPSVDAKPTLKLAKDTADSRGNPKPEVFIFHHGSVADRIKDRKCKTKRGSSRPPVKGKLAPGSSSSLATHAKTSSSKDDTSFLTISNDDEGLPNVFELKDANVCHLKVFAITPLAWKNHLDNHMDVNKKIRGECDVMKQKERAREEDCKELRTKCKASMIDFEKNPNVVAMREKMSTLSTGAKEHKANLDRMLLESQK